MKRALPSSLVLLASTLAAAAAISTNDLRLSVDVTADVRGGSFTDHQAVSAGPSFAGALIDLSAIGLPSSVELDALIVQSNRVLFSTDTSYTLGPDSYSRNDLAAYNVNTATLSLFFDGSANGLPARVNLDAASLLPGTDDLLISLDVSTDAVVPGTTVHDEDIIRFSGGTASVLVDGSADLGIPERADLDALHHDGDHLFFSLDVGADIGPLFGRDEDAWSADTNTYTMALINQIGIEQRADLVSLDELLDQDQDGLSDFEEISGVDDPGTTVPGSDIAMDPEGHTSDPELPDTDSDGSTDAEEAIAGTDPNDPGDLLRMLAISSTDGTNVVAWASVLSRTYILESSPEGTGAYMPIASGLAPTGPTSTEYTDGAPLGPVQLYRVRIDLSTP